MLLTRFELFRRRHGIPPALIAATSVCSRQHILRLRLAAAMPMRRIIVALTETCALLSKEEVTPGMLFERADLLLASRRRHRLSDLHAADLANLDSILREASDGSVVARIAEVDIATETAVVHLLQAGRNMIDTEPARATEVFSGALVVAASLSDTPAELIAALTAEAFKGRANALRQLGDFSAALAELSNAAQQFAAAEYCDAEAGQVEYTRATVFLSMEAHTEAVQAARAARRHFLAVSDTRRAVHVDILEAGIRFERGDVDAARSMFHKLRRSLVPLRDRDALARVWLNLGACELRRRDAKEARRWLTQASAAFRDLGNATELLRTRWNMATYIALFSNRQRGLRALERVARAFADMGMVADEACVELDIMEMLIEDDAPAEILSDRGRKIASTFLRIGMRLSAASAVHLLREIQSPVDARAAVDRARAELRSSSWCITDAMAGGAADLAKDSAD